MGVGWYFNIKIARCRKSVYRCLDLKVECWCALHCSWWHFLWKVSLFSHFFLGNVGLNTVELVKKFRFGKTFSTEKTSDSTAVSSVTIGKVSRMSYFGAPHPPMGVWDPLWGYRVFSCHTFQSLCIAMKYWIERNFFFIETYIWTVI